MYEPHTIGTDPAEWLEGEQVFEHMQAEMNKVGSLKFSPGEIEAWQEGTVGWGITQPTLTTLKWGQISIRWSAVFHREDNEWKMVQLHMSVGVPNPELLG
jgi:hypothetical protein